MVISYKKLTEEDFLFFKKHIEKEPITIKILTEYLAYKNNDKLNNTFSIKICDMYLGIFLVKGSSIYLHIENYTFLNDILSILSFFSGCKIIVNGNFILPFNKINTLFLLKKEVVFIENISGICNDINSCVNILSEQIAGFDKDLCYADFSHKVRRNLLNIYIKNIDNKPIGFVLEFNGFLNVSFLDMVYVLKEFRNKKIGSLLLSSLSFNEKTIFLLSENSNVDFYLKNGFRIINSYNEYKI